MATLSSTHPGLDGKLRLVGNRSCKAHQEVPEAHQEVPKAHQEVQDPETKEVHLVRYDRLVGEWGWLHGDMKSILQEFGRRMRVDRDFGDR